MEEDKTDAAEDKEDESAPRSVVIENIQNNNEEILTMLVENVLRGSSEHDFSIEVIPESNCAVVTFSTRKDTEYFVLSCLDNEKIKKRDMTVRILEKPRKVKAEGLPPGSNIDLIMLYFEKYAELEEEGVTIETEESAIITFKNPEDAAKVINQPHQIKKLPFKVLPYYDRLQTALYGKERPLLKLPEAFIEKIDRSLSQHFKTNPKSQDSVSKAMSGHFSEVDFQSPALKISPMSSLLHQGENTRKLIQLWKENARERLLDSLAQFISVELHVPKDVWTNVQAEIEMVTEEAVTLISYAHEETIAIAGPQERVNSIEGILKETILQATQKAQRTKGSESGEIRMLPSIYNLVVCQGVEQEIRNKFPQMDLTYLVHSEKLTFYGLKNEVLETKSKVLERVLSLIRKPAELNQSVLDFLLQKDLEKVGQDLFFSKGINVAFEADKSRLLLVGKTEDDLKDAEKHLMKNLGHRSFTVDDPSVLLKSDWIDLLSQIKNDVATVAVQTSADEVVVSGFLDSVDDVEKKLYDFVQENSQIEKTLKAHKTVVAFVEKHKTQEWSEEAKSKVNVDFKVDSLMISGPRLHVSRLESLFNRLLSSTHHSTMKIVKPGAKKYFKENKFNITYASTNFNCLVELMDDPDHPRPTPRSMKIKPLYQHKIREGLVVNVHKADMCTFKADAVVGTCNKSLILDGGLAKALSDAVGPNLQNECNTHKGQPLSTGDVVFLGAGGQLQCNHVIFVVGPHYNAKMHQESVKLLETSVKKTLNKAVQYHLQSLAIPAISSGNYGFPLDVCALTIVKTIKGFCEFFEGGTTLKEINLVDNNDKTVQALQDAVKNVFGLSAHSKPSVSSGSPAPNQPQTTVFFQGASHSFKTKEGLTVTLMKGNIENTTMDVVVNTLSSDLNLGVGAISNALLKAAGPQLQVLLNQQVTGSANIGAIFETAGANLKNKLVFHAVVPHWNKGLGQEQKVLEDIMDKCLSKAEQRKQSSIVFSAIGTGNLGFPKPVVACLMLDSIFQFSSKRSSKCVQEVVFALNPKDAQTIQKLNYFLPVGHLLLGPFSKIVTKSGIHETTLGGITLQVLKGDITAEKTDVIVSSTNNQFTLKAGVSKAILDKAGPTVEDECKQNGSKANGVLMTQAGNLQCKRIIHIAAQSNAALLQKYVTKALEMCDGQKLTSIALPAIGTGQAGQSASQVADSMMDGIIDFFRKTPQSSLKLIRLVVFQDAMLPDFHRSLQSRETSPPKQEKDSTWSKIKAFAASAKSYFTGSWEKEMKQHGGKDFVIEGMEADPVFFSVCGSSQADVEKTKDFLKETVDRLIVSHAIKDPSILHLTEEDQERIQDLQKTIDVTIKFEYTANKVSKDAQGEAKLIVEGLDRDVLKGSEEIREMLKIVKEQESLRKEMELVKEIVEWQYEQGGHYKKFDKRINFQLEQALANEAPDIKLNLQGQTYQVKLPEGPAVSSTGGNQMNIRRIDKLKASESIPQNWDAMPSNDLVKKFNLPTTNSEYQEVLKLFKATCSNRKVLKIERIQNPGMWRNYQNNKSIMEKKNGHVNNEKKLFHGTSEQTLVHIEKDGFNRSYAGQHAAAYGNGTYFALNASYSSSDTYSAPNPLNNHKHMYLCRVLTGDYTTGQGGMKVPPVKPGTLDNYDTVVDNPNSPTIFVVMKDDHAYPEYLITFT
ncbi:hypothetical protein DNTS_005427 [Danionella cerebrum]|uniref:Poly [ADP-ribose] polymerase n=1 Tax=Danionella cerebrum TaxID=2873325 RepID=A0A553RKQ4_9TELE|nr:hypothetical protein DNTS_005427 [Danionella translucida]